MAKKKNPTPVDAYVGQRVKMRRLQLGFSQEKLGKACDLTFQQIQKYEKGANRIGASRLQQLADILDTTPDYFFKDAPGVHARKNGNGELAYTRFISDQQGQKLMEGWAMLANQERLAIIGLVNSLGRRSAR